MKVVNNAEKITGKKADDRRVHEIEDEESQEFCGEIPLKHLGYLQ
jgi:hypothetical protein